ncbi:sensor histidine kinase [Halarsenatibacter silvermanii]|uniref:histidine kinase n=1 Tax=Halarsenatibacter silvermanii TaxID=321763 RepID=A0A1G9GYT4_9FIRM|nr:sensor histidine kinase [Halarsenatibacter silvermanii]SDL05816.1 two-component system, NarL family, sensor histidine kinase DegS [Halarsenatibacter silvermanii]
MRQSENPEDLNVILDNILDKTLDIIDDSRQDVFAIAESSREELENIESELEMIKEEINEVIDELEKKERINKRARRRLMEVSRDFENYSEEEVREVYKKAEDSSVDIAVLREKEQQLQDRRRKLEEKHQLTKRTLKRSENLTNRLGMVKDFLEGQMENVSRRFDELEDRERFIMDVIQMQEEERRRVAREIHDGPAQSLANLVMRVEVAQNTLYEDRQRTEKELEDLKQLIKSSVSEVRRIIYDLRPMSIDDLGLIPTLREYIENFREETDIEIDIEVLGDEKKLPSPHEITVFRLVQEALNNIKKHAEASWGQVRVEFASEHLNLLISDDGVGFDSGDSPKSKSFGIKSMQERCNLLDGELKISSGRNKGTRINIKIPLNQKKG